ncbi:hypothetical protein ACLMJK_006010 [Lecanora helva]
MAASEYANFIRSQRFCTDYAPATVTQYQSSRTGLTIAVVDQEGPTVHGTFALATEIHDDSGAPHTLEHLCFMGSKKYPYNGVLDKLGARAYSETNALTATLDCAGWQAFAQILPVYLSHIIEPLLSDASCYTEVHHINGEGNDAGVVYSEMQDGENSADLLMFSKLKKLLYKEGVGFRYDTFGIMSSLRALTAARIREYHREMYQPKNLCVVVIGEIEHESLLSILCTFEDTILETIPNPEASFHRPWIDSKKVLPLEDSITEVIEFPEEDESSGQITISFLGAPYSDNLLCSATLVLLAYLAGSPASVLENTLVEKEQLASAVLYEHDAQPITAIHFTLSSVATEDLGRVNARFLELLQDIAGKPLDMKYMLDCIQREKRQRKFYAENPSQFFTKPIITDFLFGDRDGSNLVRQLETLSDFDLLESWSDSQWRYWLRLWFSGAAHVTVIGKPSAALSDRLKANEEARVKARQKDLGEQGLMDLKRRLESAKAENDREIPEAIIKDFEIPNTESIHFIGTTTARSGLARSPDLIQHHAQQIIDRDTVLPLFLHFEYIQTNFAYLTIVISTEVLPLSQRPLLAIFMENFFSAPMLRDGETIGFERILMELERDTVSYTIESGSRLGNSETITIKLEVEVEKYETAIRWFRDLMTCSVFDPERIKATTARLLADIPDEKRDGSDMANSVELMVGTAPSSITRACNTLVRAAHLKRVKHILSKEPDIIINQLKDMSSALFNPSNFRILVVADVEKLQHPVSSWQTLISDPPDSEKDQPLRPLETRLARLSPQGQNPGNVAYIIPMPPLESSFVLAVSKGASSFSDPIFPALMVATSYLNVVEGPLWKAIRGTGLAYNTTFYRHTDSGQVSLEVYRAPDPLKAFFAAKDVVRKLVIGESAFNTFTLEGAISSIVLGFANAESTRASAAESSFVRQVMRGLPKDWPTLILEKVMKVSVDEIRRVMELIFFPIFDRRTSNVFVTCAPSMEEKVKAGLEEAGFEPQVKPLAFFQDDYGLGDGKEEEDESEGDEEMEDEEMEDGEDDEDDENDESDHE